MSDTVLGGIHSTEQKPLSPHGAFILTVINHSTQRYPDFITQVGLASFYFLSLAFLKLAAKNFIYTFESFIHF